MSESPAGPIFLSEADVSDLIDFPGTIDVLDTAFRAVSDGGVVNRPRTRIPLGGATYNLMSAGWTGEGVVGLKVYTVSKHGAPMHILLHAADGTGLLAVMAAGRISGLRTGSASGLSARYMAREGDGPIGIIGTGFQAVAQVHGVVAATGARVVNVYSRDEQKRTALAARLAGELGITVNAVDNVKSAAARARVLVVITNAKEPVLSVDDVDPGTHIVAAGNNTWLNSEIAPELVGRCDVVVTDDVDQARLECGELMRAADTGLISWDRVIPLADVVAGRRRGRNSADDITLFEAQGVAIEDVALAAHLYRAAVAKGRGLPLQ